MKELLTTTAQVLKKISRIIKKRDKLNKELDSLQIQLKTMCDHSQTKKEYSYIEGSYYNRGEYRTSLQCKVCGIELKTETQDAGYG